jgi:hypothetical protein
MIARITLLANRMGLDPVQLLGGSVVDADFEEVPRELSEAEMKKKSARDRENELSRLKRRMTPEEWEAHKARTRAEKSKRGKIILQQHQQQSHGEFVARVNPLAETPDDDLSDIY